MLVTRRVMPFRRCHRSIVASSNLAKSASAGLKGKFSDLAALAKFQLSSLVVVTTGAGFICAGIPIDWSLMAATCFGTGLCAASAATFNQVAEIARDSKMRRTLSRPLPSGRVTKSQAILWGSATGISGVSLLCAATNPVVAALGAFNIGLYSGAYTYSKQYTELNTWIGSLVGAIPPIMGWAAATGGSLMTPEPWALASILFLWQFPHFFALSWLHREDYARGAFQMVAVNDPIGTRSANLIFEYSVYLTLLPIVTSVTGLTSHMFAVEGTVINAYLLYLCKKFKDDRTNANARKIFLTSLWYLPLLLAGYVFHSRMWNKQELLLEDGAEADNVTEAVQHAKEKLKGMCIHEIIASKEETSSPHLCMKIASDKVIDAAERGADVVVSSTATAVAAVVAETVTENSTLKLEVSERNSDVVEEQEKK